MRIIREIATPIKQAALLPVKEGLPWCEDHEEYFEVCICPKQHSTPEEDGWLVENTPSGQVAYPTEQLYIELSLWIQRQGGVLICTKCEGDATFPDGHTVTETESQDLVEAFFDIHSACGVKGIVK